MAEIHSLSSEARSALKVFLQAYELEGMTKKDAAEVAAQQSRLSAVYILERLQLSPAAKRERRILMQELWEQRAEPQQPFSASQSAVEEVEAVDAPSIPSETAAPQKASETVPEAPPAEDPRTSALASLADRVRQLEGHFIPAANVTIRQFDEQTWNVFVQRPDGAAAWISVYDLLNYLQPPS